jgi:toxin ParE1/3/4
VDKTGLKGLQFDAGRWLRTALRNLDDEAMYIATDDPKPAQLVVRRILGAVAVLAEQPALGCPGRVVGTRELVELKTRYIVPYRVQGQTVEILRVFHTSRRPPQKCETEFVSNSRHSASETTWTAFVRGLKDWSQILCPFGLIAATMQTLRN